MNTSTDRIERQIQLKAPRSRVWRALTNADEFGSWFGVVFDGQQFRAGQRVNGRVTYPGYEHVRFDIDIEEIEPEHLFSWRWHPAAVESGVDYSSEPTTLVVFSLEEKDGGTLLRVTESGFDQIPPARRLNAFRMNSGGWDDQIENVQKHLATT